MISLAQTENPWKDNLMDSIANSMDEIIREYTYPKGAAMIFIFGILHDFFRMFYGDFLWTCV